MESWMKLFDGLARYQPQALAALRIMTALQFMEHGTQKLFNFPVSDHAGALTGLTLTAGILELAGGILLALGLFTRPVAFLLAGEMAIAYFMAPAPELSRWTTAAAPESLLQRRARRHLLIRSRLASNSGADCMRAAWRLPRSSISKPSVSSAISFGITYRDRFLRMMRVTT